MKPNNLLRHLSLTTFLGAVALGASAQTASDEEETLEEITVVGSRVQSGSLQDSPVPVDSVSGEVLYQSGYPDVGQALQHALPSFNYSFSSITDGTDSVLPATLRGLDPDQTLVLVDGKRRHTSALIHVNGSIGRGSAGVDINAVPGVAFERVDVLRDGASALYGSDAIAGVMDLRLKRTSPATISLHTGAFTEGDGESTRLSFNWGGHISDIGTLFVAVESRDRGRTNRAGLMGTQNYPALDLSEVRANPNDNQRSQLAAYDAQVAEAKLDPDLSESNGCDADFNLLCDPREFTLPRQTFRVGDPDTEQLSYVVNTAWQLGKGELYANHTYSTRENESGCFYREADDATRNNPQLYPDGFLPRITTDIEDTSLSAGYRWKQGDAQYDVSYSQGDNNYDFGLVNSHNASWGTDSPTTANAGGPRYGQTLINFDGLIELSEAIQLAFGAEQRSETYNLQPGERVSYAAGLNDDPMNPRLGPDINPAANPPADPPAFGMQCFPGFRPRTAGERSRDNFSAYVEVGVETDFALINAAARLENYSDFGAALTWRAATLLKLSESIRLRGSIGTSLRAPSLPQLYYNTISTLSIDNVLTETATLPSYHPFLRELGIGELTEESASNISLGLALQLTDNLGLTLDYYSVDIDDRIILSGQLTHKNLQKRIAEITDPDVLARAQRAAAVFTDNQVNSAQFFLNATQTETEGTDLVLEWQTAGRLGDLLLKISTNITDTKVVGGIARPGFLDLFSEAEIFNSRDRSIIEDWQPGSKLIVSASWLFNQWSIYASLRNFGEYSVSNVDGDEVQEYGPSSTLDARVSYNWQDRLQVAFGGTNLLDAYPEYNNINSPR